MSDAANTLQALQATAQFLQQLARLPPEQRLEWLRQQGPAGRRTIMQHINAYRAEMLGQQWQLGQRKRVVHQQQSAAMSALDRLGLVRRMAVDQLHRQLGIIFADPATALGTLWQEAGADSTRAAALLRSNPEHFAPLRGRRVFGLPSPARLRAGRALKTFDFPHLWNLYNQVEHLRVQLEQQLETTRHVRH